MLRRLIHIDCGKAFGIQKILEHYGYCRNECIAFGDGGNDIDMLQYAGIGVAMGNSKESVKAAADYITEDCDSDGVVSALLHFRLI